MTNSNTNNSILNKPYSINLYKTYMYFNQLSINYKNKEYTLDEIYFYNENGIVNSVNKCWFGNNSFNVSIPVSNELTRKLKKDYSKNIPFIIKSNYENRYDLYLPISDFNISCNYIKTGNMIMSNYSFIANNNVKCTWSNCEKYFGSETFEIKTEYDKILNNLEDLRTLKENDFLDNIEKLKSIFNKYQKAIKEWNSFTIEDYLKEYPTMNMKYYNN